MIERGIQMRIPARTGKNSGRGKGGGISDPKFYKVTHQSLLVARGIVLPDK